MPKRNHRPQLSDQVSNEDTRQVVVHPLTNLDDRVNNPKDIEPDEAAMANGMAHGGTQESRAETLNTRGSGGRKRTGPFGRHRVGQDLSKRR